jgi:2-octaprenyl-6-methoxyphenol hydroxylase
MGLEPADFAALLADRIGPDLGAITLDGARQVHPLALSLAESYRAARVVLVGDAAHGVHPIAGQGLNLGLRDVAALAEVLVGAHRRGEDIGGDIPLAAYERWRRPDATLLALGMDAVNRLFSNDFGPLRAVRGLGMAAVSALPGLRRSFIREAAGLAGDVPRLLTGRTL